MKEGETRLSEEVEGKSVWWRIKCCPFCVLET